MSGSKDVEIPVKLEKLILDSESKEVIITVSFYQGNNRVYNREIIINVDNIQDAETISRSKTATDWAEKGFYT